MAAQQTGEVPAEPGPAARRCVVIEDEPDLRELLCHVMTQAGLEVTEAATAAIGLAEVRRVRPDLVTLDMNLPDMDGVEVCRQLRSLTDAYIVIVSARDEELDRLMGLEVGADDYVTKPFSPRELRARVAAMFRRPRSAEIGPDSAADEGTPSPPSSGAGPSSGVVRAGGLELDVEAHEARLDGSPLTLTVTEFRILAALVTHPGRVWTRPALLREAWDTDWVGDTHLVDVHVGNLRRKLGDDGKSGRFIRTVRGVGYRLGGG